MRGQVVVLGRTGKRVMYIEELGIFIGTQIDVPGWALTVDAPGEEIWSTYDAAKLKRHFESIGHFTSTFEIPVEIATFIVEYRAATQELNEKFDSWLLAKVHGDSPPVPTADNPETNRRLMETLPQMAEQIDELIQRVGGLQ